MLRAIVPIISAEILGGGTPTPPLPDNRFDGINDYAEARALFESDPHVRVLLENGAGSPTPGLPGATFELGFARWPAHEVEPTKWWLGANGELVSQRPRGDGGADAYHPDPAARPQQPLAGDGAADSWRILPPYDWRPLVDGTAVAYATPPLEDVTIVGPGSVDLWIRSCADDSDLQVTLSEVRPDDRETYVQNGWLRASHRRLGRQVSTVLEPRPSHLERDARPLKDGKFTKLRVPLLAVAHVFRKGSRIQHQHRGARWRPHALALRHAADRRHGAERDRVRPRAPVAHRAAGGAGGRGAAGAAAVPGAARAALREYVPAANGG